MSEQVQPRSMREVLQELMVGEECYLEDIWIGEHLGFGMGTMDVRWTPQQLLDEWIQRGEADDLVIRDEHFISLHCEEDNGGDTGLYRIVKGAIPQDDVYAWMLEDNRRMKAQWRTK